MTFATLAVFAAMSASGLISSPTQINQREGINLDRLAKSPLDGLPAEECAKRTAERERIGRELTGLIGFELGKKLDEYGFRIDEKGSDDPSHPVLFLPNPVMGFSRFRPIIVTDRLCGLLLNQPVEKCRKERDWQALFETADATVRTNLAESLGVQTNDLSRSTNGVTHLWRFSLERWNHSLVLHINDRELISQLVRAAKEAEEAADRERARKLMGGSDSHEDVKKEEEGKR